MFDNYSISEASEEGIKVPIKTPDGRDLGDWLRILGFNSSKLRTSLREHRKKIAAFSDKNKDKVEQEDYLLELALEYKSEAVIGWSFDEDCNKENVLKLLRGWPALAAVIDRASSDDALFIKKKLTSSSSSLDGDSA